MHLLPSPPAFDIEAHRHSLGNFEFYIAPTLKPEDRFMERRFGVLGYIVYQWCIAMIFIVMGPLWLFSQFMPIDDARPYALLTTFIIVAILNVLDFLNDQRMFKRSGIAFYQKGIVFIHLYSRLKSCRFDEIREVKSGQVMGVVGKVLLNGVHLMDSARLVIVLKNGKTIKLHFFTHLYDRDAINFLLSEFKSKLALYEEAFPV